MEAMNRKLLWAGKVKGWTGKYGVVWNDAGFAVVVKEERDAVDNTYWNSVELPESRIVLSQALKSLYDQLESKKMG